MSYNIAKTNKKEYFNEKLSNTNKKKV